MNHSLVLPEPAEEVYTNGTGEDFHFSVECSKEGLKRSILNHLHYTLALHPEGASHSDWWNCLCLAVRDRILHRSGMNRRVHAQRNVRRLYYFSLEYLMGRMLDNNLRNLELWNEAQEAMADLGQDLNVILEEEPDMGLGNGGLGRLAACFLESLSTLNYPAVGYGIHYEFGLFRQSFDQFSQMERPDNWNQLGSPWTITRPDYAVTVNLYGRVEQTFDDLGHGKPIWIPAKSVIGIPSDIPIAGYQLTTVNYLRLWESRSSEQFNLQVFNEGGYIEAVRDKAEGETISKVLYPNDSTAQGRELRLVQEYFFVACSLRDIMRRHWRDGNNWDNFAEKVAIQLNDTHPALAIVEFMRLMIDEHDLPWDRAWSICQATFAYTNHTLLPEALERWSVPLFEKVLPRHLQIIYEINQHFLNEVVLKKWPADFQKTKALSIIEESHPKMVRMAHLAVLGSHTTNGVAAMHSRLITERLFPEFFQLYPERFQNKTNGVTPRRWLNACNPELAALITRKLESDSWTLDLDRIRGLERFARDASFQQEFMTIKHRNKERLTHIIRDLCEVEVDPAALFDVQIKRLHEYKRQHLNLLHILTLYRRLLNNPKLDIVPRVFVFAAKAAPGYAMAKHIIHCINAVAHKINSDTRIEDKLKVAFLPNYGVTLAERIIPAADLSEQISTAGKEASGTGNMKLALNGALTIGTLDGANVEILEEVGPENIFIFGLTVEDVTELRRVGYSPFDLYWGDEELRSILEWLDSGFFTPHRDATHAVKSSLLEGGDPFLVLADYREYLRSQAEVDDAYRNRASWAEKSILNTARVGKFSSDRTIREYAEQIWKLPAVEMD